jgi:hypothetical protein
MLQSEVKIPEINLNTELQRLSATQDSQVLGQFILQHYQQLLEQQPQQLMALLPTCLAALASEQNKEPVNKGPSLFSPASAAATTAAQPLPTAKTAPSKKQQSEALIASLVEKMMAIDGDYPPLFLMELRLCAFNAILPALAENKAIYSYLELMAFQIWAQLQKHNRVTSSLLAKSPRFLFTPAMLNVLAEQIILPTKNETTCIGLALDCLQIIAGPITPSEQSFTSSSFATNKILERLYSNLLSAYMRGINVANFNRIPASMILRPTAHLIRQGIRPPEVYREKWIEALLREATKKVMNSEILDTINTLILLHTSAQPLLAKNVEVLFNKLLECLLNKNVDKQTVIDALIALYTNNGTDHVPLLFNAHNRKTISLQILCAVCATLSSLAIERHLLPLSLIIGKVITTKPLAESAPVLPLLQQHKNLLMAVINAIDGKGAWNATTLMLLYNDCGHPDADELILDPATRANLMNRLMVARPIQPPSKNTSRTVEEEWSNTVAPLDRLRKLARTPDEKSKLRSILRPMLDNHDHQFQQLIFKHLVELPSTQEQKSVLWSLSVRQLMDSKEAEDRCRAIDNLSTLATTSELKTQLRDLLLRKLRNDADSVCNGAFNALIALATSLEEVKELWDLLMGELKKPQWTVPLASAGGLTTLAKTPQQKAELWPLLSAWRQDNNMAIRQQALHLLAQLATTPTQRIELWHLLLPMLQNEDEAIRQSAYNNLIELGHSSELSINLWELLIAILRNQESKNARLFSSDAISVLMALASTPAQKDELWSLLLNMYQTASSEFKSLIKDCLFLLARTPQHNTALGELLWSHSLTMLQCIMESISKNAITDLFKLADSPEQKSELRTQLLAKLQVNYAEDHHHAVSGLLALASTPALKAELWLQLQKFQHSDTSRISNAALFGLSMLTSSREQEELLWSELIMRLNDKTPVVQRRAEVSMGILLLRSKQGTLSRQLSATVLKLAPRLFHFLKLKEAGTFLTIFTMDQLEKALDHLKYLDQFIDIRVLFREASRTTHTSAATLSPADVKQLTVTEVLVQLRLCRNSYDELMLIAALYECGLHTPCKQLFEVALECPTLYGRHSTALVELLISLNIEGLKLTPVQMLGLMLPVYIDSDTPPVLCLRIENFLCAQNMVQLPVEFLEVFLHRAQRGEKISNELLGKVDLQDYLRLEMNQVNGSSATEQQKATQLLSAAPLSQLIRCAVLASADGEQVSTAVQDIIIRKMTALGRDSDGELGKTSLPLLIRYFELQLPIARDATRPTFANIVKEKLAQEPWPVRENTLMIEPPVRIPVELQPAVATTPTFRSS